MVGSARTRIRATVWLLTPATTSLATACHRSRERSSLIPASRLSYCQRPRRRDCPCRVQRRGKDEGAFVTRLMDDNRWDV